MEFEKRKNQALSIGQCFPTCVLQRVAELGRGRMSEIKSIQ